MTLILVDSNILIDVVARTPFSFEWSATRLADVLDGGTAAINPLIYPEFCGGYNDRDTARTNLPRGLIHLPLPYDAACPASEAHRAYRQRGAPKLLPCPTFSSAPMPLSKITSG